VQPDDWPEFLQRQYRAVANGGRLIVCHYRERIEVAGLLRRLGYAVAGEAEVVGTSASWCTRPE
jgi:hypothetical protein